MKEGPKGEETRQGGKVGGKKALEILPKYDK